MNNFFINTIKKLDLNSHKKPNITEINHITSILIITLVEEKNKKFFKKVAQQFQFFLGSPYKIWKSHIKSSSQDLNPALFKTITRHSNYGRVSRMQLKKVVHEYLCSRLCCPFDIARW